MLAAVYPVFDDSRHGHERKFNAKTFFQGSFLPSRPYTEVTPGYRDADSKTVSMDEVISNLRQADKAVSGPSFQKEVEAFRRDLERLKDGWCGESSLAPQSAVLSDLDNLLVALPETSAVPDFEVDEGCGHLTLRWQKSGAKQALSFVFQGRGEVLVIVTSLGDGPTVASKRFKAKSGDAIARFIESDEGLVEVLKRV